MVETKPLVQRSWSVAIGVLIALVLGTSGCGSKEPEASVADVTPNSETADYGEGPTAPSSGVESFSASNEWQATVESTDGSTVGVSVELGELVRPADFNLGDEFIGLDSACGVDPERDAFIPGQIRTSNTTDGFTTDVTTGINIRSYDPQPEGFPMQAAKAYDSGNECVDAQGVNFITVSARYPELSSDAQGLSTFLLVVKNYYSPNTPDGDTGRFDNMSAAVWTPADWGVTCMSGPGTSHSFFRLDGSEVESDGSEDKLTQDSCDA